MKLYNFLMNYVKFNQYVEVWEDDPALEAYNLILMGESWDVLNSFEDFETRFKDYYVELIESSNDILRITIYDKKGQE